MLLARSADTPRRGPTLSRAPPGRSPRYARRRERPNTAAAAALYAEDLAAKGVEAPALVARLLVAAATEVALTELETGRRSSAIRRVFERLIPTA